MLQHGRAAGLATQGPARAAEVPPTGSGPETCKNVLVETPAGGGPPHALNGGVRPAMLPLGHLGVQMFGVRGAG